MSRRTGVLSPHLCAYSCGLLQADVGRSVALESDSRERLVSDSYLPGFSSSRRLINVVYTNFKTGVYISVRKRYLFPPPPLWKWYFFPLSRHVVFRLPSWSFCLTFSLFCIYFTLLLPLFSFYFPFLSFSFLFLPFSFTFSPFFSSPFHIFSPKWHGPIFPLPGGGVLFSKI